LLREVADRATVQAVVLTGTNADDATEFRPGLLAGKRFTVQSPLLDEGIDKSAVRSIARALDLAVAEKAPLACLASRVAYGLRISPELLRRIDQAEAAIRSLGFASVRVRHHGPLARIEVAGSQVNRLAAHPRFPQVVGHLHALGWTRVEIDPSGYRPGNLNRDLQIAPGLAQAWSRIRTAGGPSTG
jgi:uncharacterized protein